MSDLAQSSFLDRTLRGAWRAIAGVARGKPNGLVRASLPDADLDRVTVQLHDCLEARGGEVSARGRAAGLGRTYLSLNSQGRRRFLAVLAREASADPGPIDAAMEAVREAPDAVSRQRAQRLLREALRPPRYTLYKQFTTLPEGVKFLVDLRAELIEYCREDRSLEVLEAELKSLLAAWFDVGFLELTRIEWDSPASLLEKLIQYEAVHRIDGWKDLKNRLGSDRRCFAFFHPRMPNEPLIFVEVALVAGLADNIQALLDTEAPATDPEEADAAIFYSISNAQRGLAGISFGDFLIKRVVDLLALEFKGLKTFGTLSPIPGFASWLAARLDRVGDRGEGLLNAAERKRVEALRPGLTPRVALRELMEEPHWHLNQPISEALEGPLLRLCARYLLKEKTIGGDAANAVAHFHLSNGARIDQLNWRADTSANGLAQSAGIMVNYLYRLGEIESNHERYRGEHQVRASSAVRNLLRLKR